MKSILYIVRASLSPFNTIFFGELTKKYVYEELSCLRHLRELRADGNQISDLEGLENMQGLVKLSVKKNVIRRVDFSRFKWYE